ncbi:MAG: hypothetical protein ACK4R2_13460 [Roseateles sp.]
MPTARQPELSDKAGRHHALIDTPLLRDQRAPMPLSLHRVSLGAKFAF